MRTQNSESKIIKKSFNSPVYWSKEQLNYEVPKPQGKIIYNLFLGNSASKINLKGKIDPILFFYFFLQNYRKTALSI